MEWTYKLNFNSHIGSQCVLWDIKYLLKLIKSTTKLQQWVFKLSWLSHYNVWSRLQECQHLYYLWMWWSKRTRGTHMCALVWEVTYKTHSVDNWARHYKMLDDIRLITFPLMFVCVPTQSSPVTLVFFSFPLIIIIPFVLFKVWTIDDKKPVTMCGHSDTCWVGDISTHYHIMPDIVGQLLSNWSCHIHTGHALGLFDEGNYSCTTSQQIVIDMPIKSELLLATTKITHGHTHSHEETHNHAINALKQLYSWE